MIGDTGVLCSECNVIGDQIPYQAAALTILAVDLLTRTRMAVRRISSFQYSWSSRQQLKSYDEIR